MTHIIKKTGNDVYPVCGAKMTGFWSGTEVAFISDCDDCRAVLLIGPKSQKGCEAQPQRFYTPEPLPDADQMLVEKQKKVDGR